MVMSRGCAATSALPAETRLAELQTLDTEAVREGASSRSGEDGHGLPIQVLRSEHGSPRCSLS